MTDAEAELIAAVEQDAEFRERLTATFNDRATAQGWVRDGRLVEPAPAFEFLMGAQAALEALGLPGFNGMELVVASARGADFVFPIRKG